METDHSTNSPFLSILFGTLLGLGSYLIDNGPVVVDFGLNLLKVCFFGLAGGIFGKIGNAYWTKVTSKKRKS
jgi:hypothetical protein